MVAGVELTYNTSASAIQMAETIMGDRVTVTGATYTGDSRASAIYSDGDSIAPGVTPSDTGVILSTGQASAFTRVGSQSNVSSSTTTANNGPNGLSDFNDLAGFTTYDASFIDIDFIPDPGIEFLTIKFVFGSEEFPEYSNSIYNDVVGVWANGAPVELAVGDASVSIGNVNESDNINLFQNNTGDQFNTEMDGFTISMSLTIPVNPGINSLRIGIADGSDSQYDSNLLIAADSVQGDLVAREDVIEVLPDTVRTVEVLDNDINNTGGTLTITEINGIPVTAGDTVTLNTGQTITLLADGTLEVTPTSAEGVTNFTYELSSSTGQSTIGMVTLDTVPCFVAGTGILTPKGEVAVESLQPGDLVETRDDGPQPIRWIGRRQMRAGGEMAPIWIRAGAFGCHRTLMVSPLHRILVENAYAELFFGEAEVLIAARDLVDGVDVKICEGGVVEYVHLLFDRHQVLCSNGLPSESFLPGPQTTHCFEAQTVAEIASIFPELDPETGFGYSPAARRALKRHEARLMVA